MRDFHCHPRSCIRTMCALLKQVIIIALLTGVFAGITVLADDEGEDVPSEFHLNVFQRGNKYGYRNVHTGKEVIAPRFEDASSFEGGLAAVKYGGKWGFIHPQGQFVIKPQFDLVMNFIEGAAVAGTKSQDGVWKFGYIGPTGHWFVKPAFRVAYPFSEGLACVTPDNKKFGYIDISGAFVVQPRYDFGQPFHEGKAVVSLARKRGFVDYNGDVAIKPSYHEAQGYSEGLAAVRKDAQGKWGYIDHSGSLVIPYAYDDAHRFRWGEAFVLKNKDWVKITRDGKQVKPD